MKTEEVLLARYQSSPLLSLTQLAEVLGRWDPYVTPKKKGLTSLT